MNKVHDYLRGHLEWMAKDDNALHANNLDKSEVEQVAKEIRKALKRSDKSGKPTVSIDWIGSE